MYVQPLGQSAVAGYRRLRKRRRCRLISALARTPKLVETLSVPTTASQPLFRFDRISAGLSEGAAGVFRRVLSACSPSSAENVAVGDHRVLRRRHDGLRVTLNGNGMMLE